MRLVLSAGALYVVFRQLDIPRLKQVVVEANLGWILLALGAYVLSKVISAFRLMAYLRCQDIVLSPSKNLRLYFIGMFYNLFLPGGIGGDAYKVWILHRDLQVPAGKSAHAMLFERFSGLVALAAIGFLLTWLAFPKTPYDFLIIGGFLLTLPASYAVHRWFGKQYLPVLRQTTLTSVLVQLVQVICAWALLQSLHIQENLAVYLAVFLLSSLVAVLPISIGGIGLRELVFVTAAGYSSISRESSVAFSLLFFVVTALSSLPGGLTTFRR